METSIGLGDAVRSELDCPEPVPLLLQDGRVIQVAGRIDRIDRLQSSGSEIYAIWDYKSGSDVTFKTEPVFQQGRKLQPILYIGMLKHRVEAMGEDPDAVESFGYFFPSPKTEGNRIQWGSTKLEPGWRLIEKLTQLMQSGVFVPTNESKDCTFCEYQAVCGNPNVVAYSGYRKASSGTNSVLSPWREIRSIQVREDTP